MDEQYLIDFGAGHLIAHEKRHVPLLQILGPQFLGHPELLPVNTTWRRKEYVRALPYSPRKDTPERRQKQDTPETLQNN